MAAALSGIWNHAAQTTSPLGGAKAMDDTSDDSSNDGATISANDFLTLLVTEMQNQDPTADTDPNEYINQLVNVNSLEQLININQTLTTAIGGSTSGDSSSQAKSASSPTAAAQNTSSASHAPTSAAAAHAAASAHPAHASTAAVVSGNLGTPQANPSALRVARALDHPRITR